LPSVNNSCYNSGSPRPTIPGIPATLEQIFSTQNLKENSLSFRVEMGKAESSDDGAVGRGTFALPPHSWVRPFAQSPPDKTVHTFARPNLMDTLPLLQVAGRVTLYLMNERFWGRHPIFDFSLPLLEPPKPGPYAGVPLGGLGCGALGMAWNGEWNRWSLNQGPIRHGTVTLNRFHLRIKRHGQPAQVLPLGNRSSTATTFNDMREYHGIFPQAYTVYPECIPGISVLIHQVSPFLPGSYSEASLPVGVFNFEIRNDWCSTSAVEVAILFMWQNSVDPQAALVGPRTGTVVAHSKFESAAVSGVSMAKEITVDPASSCECCLSPSISTTNLASVAPHHNYNEHERGASEPHVNETGTGRRSSMAIATLMEVDAGDSDNHGKTRGEVVSSCPYLLVVDAADASEQASLLSENGCPTVSSVLHDFERDGHIRSVMRKEASKRALYEGSTQHFHAAGALCHSRLLNEQGQAHFSFGLAWDQPQAHFGDRDSSQTPQAPDLSKETKLPKSPLLSKSSKDSNLRTPHQVSPTSVPKYYTRFFGASGLSAAALVKYALIHHRRWAEKIDAWQASVVRGMSPDCPSFLKHQCFNELYYLVEGGTLWLDTCGGQPNTPQQHKRASSSPSSIPPPTQDERGYCAGLGFDSGPEPHPLSGSGSDSDHTVTLLPPGTGTSEGSDRFGLSSSSIFTWLIGLLRVTAVTPAGAALANRGPSPDLQGHLLRRLTKDHAQQLSTSFLSTVETLWESMSEHDKRCQACSGDQRLVGQFLMLEGMEYLMYNTVDVGFYSSFAIVQLWPMLELSMQYDVAACVTLEDLTLRTTLGEGTRAPRKVAGVVPHDLGSPSGYPWRRCNDYCFQDTSRWKDLGPKFILQSWRDYYVTGDLDFLQSIYEVMVTVATNTATFDCTGDGMIKNEGFPDQTYDCWTCTGVSAYSGGLWVAACEAMAAAAKVLDRPGEAFDYGRCAERARSVLIDTLWNGHYLNYDSSNSKHSKSIMADMCAGVWYCLSSGLPPPFSVDIALSCLDTVFVANVLWFGKGKWLGAVNGSEAVLRNTPGQGEVFGHEFREDRSCLQSKEVWTGTTFAVAATMLMLATALEKGDMKNPASSNRLWAVTVQRWRDGAIHLPPDFSLPALAALPPPDRLRTMAYYTAQGVHDAGWDHFGYHFNTPEAWERSGNYRSLGYSRALCVWALLHRPHSTEQEQRLDPEGAVELEAVEAKG